MPIGKNAIKRVSSSACSGIKSDAPDMKSSTIAEVRAEEAQRTEPLDIAAKTAQTKEEQKKKTTKKSAKVQKKQDLTHIALGDALPYYLL